MSSVQPGSGGTGHPAVEACELTKAFGGFVAVDCVSFSVSRGTIFGFLGPNGAGKTTTIRMLLGLLLPTSGRAMVLGYDVAQQQTEVKKHIGYMSQRFSLYDDLTVNENLTFCGRTYGLRGMRLSERKSLALHMAGLDDKQSELAGQLAGGWKQRLALGAAILHEPAVVFLDEPTAGVDPISRRAFWDLLYALAADGTTILVTTHYMDEAEHCQNLAFIQRGRIVALGSPASIKESRMRGDVLEIDCEHPGMAVVSLRRMQAFEEVALYGALIHAVAAEAHRMMPSVRQMLQEAGAGLRSMAVIAPSLEDVFISSVRGPEPPSRQSTSDMDGK